jgi:FAD/FMN-containing dehydrogenase
MGLTGLILAASLRLHPIRTAYIDQTTIKASCLEEALELFAAHHAATYSVAWIDCLASGASLGRSLLMLGEHASEGGLHAGRKAALSIPFDMPHQLLNHYSVRAFNTLYYQRIRQQQTVQHSHYEPFFYPLDGILHWNRLYGKQGFVQYQFVIPTAAGLEGLRTILRRIAASGRGSFLAVLKVFGKENANLLSFPLEGYTVALDFKRTPDLFGLLDELDAMLLEFGGRLYLTKDARMGKETFRQGYPRWEQFQSVRAQYGAIGRFASLQSRRLGLD